MGRSSQVFVAAVIAALLMGLSAAQAQVADCPDNTTAPSIAGNYTDNFGYLQSVSAAFWVSGTFVFEVCSIDEAKHAVIAINNARNPYSPGKYSRFEWTTNGSRLWYCQSVYDAATAADAAAAAPANASSPAQSGCGAAAWSQLIQILPLPAAPGS